MIPRLTAEEISDEFHRLDDIASRYRHPDGELSREEFIEQGLARLQLQLFVVAGCIDQGDWENAVRGLAPVGGWSCSLAAACVGMMPREAYVDLLRRNEELRQQRPLKLVTDDGANVILGPDTDWLDPGTDWLDEQPPAP